MSVQRAKYHVGRHGQRLGPFVAMFVPNITAEQIPRWMADNDHRGRIVELRELCKQWAHTDHHHHRAAMVEAAPRRHRWWHRFTRRRHDLTRIAAVVHALCDRDGVPVPDWVWQHRSRRDIHMTASRRRVSSLWTEHSDAPEACAYHRVWFDPGSIEDHRIHGFRRID